MGDQARQGLPSGDTAIPRERTPRDRTHTVPRRHPRWRDDLAQVVEAEIIPRLMLAHRGERRARCPAAGPLPDADRIAHLGTLLLAPNDGGASAEIRGLLDDGIPLEDLLIGLLAPTARHIGRLWEEDACDFVQVTTAMARLSRIVHDLETLCLAPQPVDPVGQRILLTPAPGESHTFGLTLAAHFFTEAGWDVVTNFDATLSGVLVSLELEWFDVVGLSLSCDVYVDRLVEAVPVLRRVSRNRDLRLIVGGPAFVGRPDRIRHVGADACVEDVRTAPEIARSLLDLRVRAC